MPFQIAIQKLTELLYPTGRAFKMPVNGQLNRMNRALSVSESEAFSNAKAILDSVLPDNANFSIDDATQWERRLGMITNQLVPLADRMLAIKRKMNHPGVIPARQHWLYIQTQLQNAGFSVWVHENIPSVSPEDYITSGGDFAQYGDFEYGQLEYGDLSTDIFSPLEYGFPLEYGMTEYGNNYNNQIANYIEPALDATFDHGANFRSAFFIGGQTYGTFADIDANRESEFRQLVLQLKPVNTIAFIFINYI